MKTYAHPDGRGKVLPIRLAAPQLEVFVHATSESVCTPALIFTVENVRTLSKATEPPCEHHDAAVAAVQAFLGMAGSDGAGAAKESGRRTAKVAAGGVPAPHTCAQELSEVDTNAAQGQGQGQVFSNDLFNDMDF